MGRDLQVPIVLGGAFAGACLKYAFAPPNIELLMPFVMVSGMLLGKKRGFLAGFNIRLIYDFYLGMPGVLTIFTALSYGLVGLLSSMIPLGTSRAGLTVRAAGLTVVYDVLTMLAFGFSFGLPLWSLVGPQVPFTVTHIAGNSAFVFVLVPALLLSAKKFIAGEPIRVPALGG
jgi:uncharacterized membrane protein